MRRSNRPVLVLCLVSVGLFAAPCAAIAQQGATAAAATGQSITLAPKFKKGDIHKFSYHCDRSDALTIGGATAGAPNSTDVVIDADLTLKVVDVGDGGAVLELTVDTIKASATMPAGKYAFDSAGAEDDKDRDNLAVLAFKPLVGMVLTIATDSAGIVSLISGDPAIAQGSLAPVANQFFTNVDNLKFRWNNVLNARRDRAPTAVNQSWVHTDSFVAMQVGKFEMTVNNTLKTVNDGTASIDATGDMKLLPAKEGDKLAWELKNTSILATSTWNLADGISNRFEMQRQFTLQGNAQGHDVVRATREKVSFDRVQK